MTKAELIRKLEGLPDDERIVIGVLDGRYEGGLKDIEAVITESRTADQKFTVLDMADGYIWDGAEEA